MSMTGYGRAQKSFQCRDITVELKSVNNRYLDCNVKMPRIYIYAEDALKQRVQNAITRGKVDVFVTIEHTGDKNVSISLNKPLLEGYLAVFQEMKQLYGVESEADALALARLPEVLSISEEQEDLEQLKDEMCQVLDMAIQEYTAMRAREGQKLYEDMTSHLDIMDEIVCKVEQRSPVTVEEYRQRLEARMKEVLESTTIDEQRILTEAAIFADKVAINEELVRLSSHMSQMRQMLASGVPVGRKLDFLIQEMNREVNTIGSKGNDLEMSCYVVDLKAEIEKIREQTQNVE